MRATMIPNMVVIRATFMPDATIDVLISPAMRIWSKAMTMPITVPRNPSDGAMEMKRVIHEHPRSRFADCTDPKETIERSMLSIGSPIRASP